MDEQRTFVAKGRRARVVYVPVSFMQKIFGGMISDNHEYINVPIFCGVPEDARLTFIFPCPERDAIGLKYTHESFDVILESCMCPEVEIKEIMFKKVKVEAVNDGR